MLRALSLEVGVNELLKFIVDDQHQGTTSSTEHIGEGSLQQNLCSSVLEHCDMSTPACPALHIAQIYAWSTRTRQLQAHRTAASATPDFSLP